MSQYLELCYVRNILSRNQCNSDLIKLLETIQVEIFQQKHSTHKFMYEMINLANDEIKKQNYKIASYDLDLIHNFPKDDISKWNEKYFYSAEFLDYCDNVLELSRIDKVKKVITLIDKYLIDTRL